MPAPNLAIFVKMSGGMIPANSRAGDLEIYDNGKLVIYESDTDIVERTVPRERLLAILQTARQSGFFQLENIMHDSGNMPNVPDVTISLNDSMGTGTVTVTGYQKLKGEMRKNAFDITYKMITDLAWESYNQPEPAPQAQPAPQQPAPQQVAQAQADDKPVIPVQQKPGGGFDLPSLDDLLKTSGLDFGAQAPQNNSLPPLQQPTAPAVNPGQKGPSLPPLPGATPRPQPQANQMPPMQQAPQQPAQPKAPPVAQQPAPQAKPAQPAPQQQPKPPAVQQAPVQQPAKPQPAPQQQPPAPKPAPVPQPPQQQAPRPPAQPPAQPPQQQPTAQPAPAKRPEPAPITQAPILNRPPKQQPSAPKPEPREEAAQRPEKPEQREQKPRERDEERPRQQENRDQREEQRPPKPQEKPARERGEQKEFYRKPPIGWEHTQELIGRLEETMKSKFLVFYAADSHDVSVDDMRYLYAHLRHLGAKKSLTLLPVISKGQSPIVWRMATLLKEFCQDLTVLLPEASSVYTTMLALSADTILMNPLGYLSPIETEFSHPLLHPGLGDGATVPLTEVLQASNMSIPEKTTRSTKAAAEPEQSSHLHPLVVTAAQRQFALTQLLCGNLLKLSSKSNRSDADVQKIVEQLTKGYPSKDYPITFSEVKALGLKVSETTEEMNDLLWELLHHYRYLSQPAMVVRDNSKSVEQQAVFIESAGRRTLFYRELHEDLKSNRVIDEYNRWRELTKQISIDPAGKEKSQLIWKDLQLTSHQEE